MTPKLPAVLHHDALPNALLVMGIALLVAPALFPVQPVLYHDTTPGTMANESELTAEGYTVLAYENLSAPAQDYYVRTLRKGGEYFVPLGQGAPEFSYPTEADLASIEDYRQRTTLQTVVIERPPNTSLPPPDEPVERAEHRLEEERAEEQRKDRESGPAESREESAETTTETGPTVEEYRQRIARYDQLSTRTDRPPLFAPRSLLRLLSVAVGVTALGTGGYLQSQP